MSKPPPPHKRPAPKLTSDNLKKRRTEETQRKDTSTNKEQETVNKAGKVKIPNFRALLKNSKNVQKQVIGRTKDREQPTQEKTRMKLTQGKDTLKN